MENERHQVLNIKLSKLDPHEIKKKLKEVFEKLKCAVDANLALGSILGTLETEQYRYF